MHRPGRWLFFVTAVLGLGLTYTQALADEAAENAKKHNAAARTLFHVGKFKQAAEEYKKAYEAKAVPEFLYNLAQCYKRLDGVANMKKAVFYLEGFLNAVPNLDNRTDIEEELSNLKQQISLQQTVAAKEPAAPAPVPFYMKWWVWGMVGAVVAGSVVAIAMTTGGDDRVAYGADGRFSPSSPGQ